MAPAVHGGLVEVVRVNVVIVVVVVVIIVVVVIVVDVGGHGGHGVDYDEDKGEKVGHGEAVSVGDHVSLLVHFN